MRVRAGRLAVWIETSAPPDMDVREVGETIRAVEAMADRMYDLGVGGGVGLHEDRLYVFMVKRLLECEAMFRPLGFRVFHEEE